MQFMRLDSVVRHGSQVNLTPGWYLMLVMLLAWPALIGRAAARKEITFDDLFTKGTFVQKGMHALEALGDGMHYTTLEQTGIVKWKYSNKRSVETLLAFRDLPDSIPPVSGYQLSPSGKFMLIETKREPIYRRSAFIDYWVYHPSGKKLTKLSATSTKQRLATISPDEKRIAYVQENNVFLYDTESIETRQVTTDGRFNHVINGAADWVYEEEFALATGMQWSPSGRFLAYYRFDESAVKEYSMPIYADELYSKAYTYKYPKAGEENAIVRIYVYDTRTDKSIAVDLGQERDQYIPRIKWSPHDELAILRLNRLQNHIDVLLADPNNGNTQIVFQDTEDRYVEQPDDWYLTFLPDGKSFIVPSERNGSLQLYLGNTSDTTCRQLTSAPQGIIELYGYCAKTQRLYYRAYDGTPLRTAIFSLDLASGGTTKISPQTGTNTAWFDPHYTFYTITHSSTTAPRSIVLYASNGKEQRVLEDNAQLQKELKQYDIPKKEFTTITTPDGVELNAYIVWPLHFDSLKRYPVMMYQYSGPNSQQVTDNYVVGWNELLATKGCIVVCVDGRGTGGRGEEFKKCTYGKLGALEAEDQMAAAHYLSRLPYVDAKRIGIWGWSYGGYMSSLCLFRGYELFKMAIAVAPVTNWRYYDSIYTERYMGLPQENPTGYDDNAPMHFADKLKGALLLIHGTADDNVHFQNSMQLVNRLIAEGKQLEMMVYPDRNHGIYGNGARTHLYARMLDFINAQLFE